MPRRSISLTYYHCTRCGFIPAAGPHHCFQDGKVAMVTLPSHSYFKTVMLGVDDLGAAIILNRNDMSISAACGLVLNGFADPLRLSRFQHGFCWYTGKALNYFWPGHCEGAVINDLLRGKYTLTLLSSAASFFKEHHLDNPSAAGSAGGLHDHAGD